MKKIIACSLILLSVSFLSAEVIRSNNGSDIKVEGLDVKYYIRTTTKKEMLNELSITEDQLVFIGYVEGCESGIDGWIALYGTIKNHELLVIYKSISEDSAFTYTTKFFEEFVLPKIM